MKLRIPQANGLQTNSSPSNENTPQWGTKKSSEHNYICNAILVVTVTKWKNIVQRTHEI